MKKILLFGLISAGLLACTNTKPENLKFLTPQELKTVMQNQDVFLVDVHVPERRHIKGTDLFVPYNQIELHLDKFPVDKKTAVYLYCQGGPMATAAARVLITEGYTEVYNLIGGSDAWQVTGFEFQ